MSLGQATNSSSSTSERLLLALGPRDMLWLSKATGIPPQTLSDYGRRGISKAEAAVKIARALEVSLDWLLAGEPPLVADSSEWGEVVASAAAHKSWPQQAIEVPVYDVDVAAGYGRTPLESDPVGYWPIPVQWIVDHLGGDPNLNIVRVSGDSQEPELRNGDMVMIDRRQNRIAAGLHVVRLDDTLMIKRIQLEGRIVRLVSNNKTYPDVPVDMQVDQDRFEIIGRAVWAGKLL